MATVGFFLVANSIFLPFLAKLEDPILLFPGAVFGMVICWVWNMVFQYDQQVHLDRLSLASKFRYSQLPPDANVFVFALRPEKVARGKKIYQYNGLLIWIFFALYPAMTSYLGWHGITQLTRLIGRLLQ